MRLAVTTYTPVPYWLSLPVQELHEYVDIAIRLQKGGK